MQKIIAFFNHKGGVGKTTATYNVAWALSHTYGKRVLMIDADPQCNLTEITVSPSELYEEQDDDTSLPTNKSQYDSNFFINNNIYEYLKNYIQPILGQEIPKLNLYSKSENLDLLAGSVRFAELESSISLSVANIPALGHIPSSLYTALKNISRDYDYVFLDLSPALSATNQMLLLLSDYFILPVGPSIFSDQALRNLGHIFRKWNRELSGFEVFTSSKKNLPQLLGTVFQNYRPYSRKNEINTKSAMRFANFREVLNKSTIELAKDLNGFDMALTEQQFNTIFKTSTPFNIANIPDFNQLVVIAEEHRLPVIALTSTILNSHNLGTPQYREKISDFQEQFNAIAEGIVQL